MLGKLVKYELKSSAKNFIPIYVGLMLVTILQVCLSKCDYFGIEAVAIIVNIVLGGGFTVVLVVTAMCIHNRFKQNLLTDEGYLMFTLPVKYTTLINSKIIGSLIWSCLSIITSIIAGFIIIWSESDVGIIEGIKNIPKIFILSWKYAELKAEVNAVIYLIAGILFIVLILIFGIMFICDVATESYIEKNSKRKSIYYLKQVPVVILGFTIGFSIFPWIRDIVEGLNIAIEFKILIYSSILCVLNLGVYIELIYRIKKKVNL